MVCIGPDKDGLFHPAAIASVEDAGDWFRINGEAIFATRPWKVFGEGPTADKLLSSSTEKMEKDIEYTSEDIRFTRSKDRKTIYVILMAWPGNGQNVTVNSLSEYSNPGLAIENVSLLGYHGQLQWSHDTEGLEVTFPDENPCNYACVLKVRLQQE